MDSRLGITTPDRLEGDHKVFYDELTELATYFGTSFVYKQSDGAFVGPFGVMIHTPNVGRNFFGLATALGQLHGLPTKAREVAILTTGAHYQSAYEKYAHTGVGSTVGLTQEEIDMIKAGNKPETLDAASEVAYDLTLQLLRCPGPLASAYWHRTKEVLGIDGATALVHYVGYYAYTSLMLNGFDVLVPESGDERR